MVNTSKYFVISNLNDRHRRMLKNNPRVCSSVVERYVDIVEAISSILITPTNPR